VPAGSLGGIGALASASRLPLSGVLHEIAKPPQAWTGTPAESMVDLATMDAARTVFDGSAREAAQLFPANANSVVVTALAGVGLDRTRVRLVADPALTRNEHRLDAWGDFGHWTMTLANAPLKDNPKSSAMTALNLVRVIENHATGLVL
jgi:aspartate dehydrogenase